MQFAGPQSRDAGCQSCFRRRFGRQPLSEPMRWISCSKSRSSGQFRPLESRPDRWEGSTGLSPFSTSYGSGFLLVKGNNRQQKGAFLLVKEKRQLQIVTWHIASAGFHAARRTRLHTQRAAATFRKGCGGQRCNAISDHALCLVRLSRFVSDRLLPGSVAMSVVLADEILGSLG